MKQKYISSKLPIWELAAYSKLFAGVVLPCLFLQILQNYSVRLVDNGSVKRGKVNLCCRFGVVSHAFAYDGNGDVLALGGTCP